MADSREIVIRPLSPANGMVAYLQFESKYFKKTDNETVTGETVAGEYVNIKFATLTQIAYQTNRDIAPGYISGNRNPIHFNKGKRLSTGKIVVKTIDRDAIKFIIEKLKGGVGKEGSEITLKSFNNFIGQELVEEAGAVPNADGEVLYMDQLPPCNIIMTARADNNSGDTFAADQKYQMKLKGVKFMTDSFGIEAAAPASDQIMDIIIAQGIEPWAKV